MNMRIADRPLVGVNSLTPYTVESIVYTPIVQKQSKQANAKRKKGEKLPNRVE